MHDREKSRLLSKLFSEELNIEEKIKLDEWLSQSEENVVYKNDLQRIWDLSGNYIPSFESNPESGFAKFKQRTRLLSDQKNSPGVIRLRPGRLLIRVAAVFLLLFVATFLIKPEIFMGKKTLYASADVIETSILSDGSRIWLNKGSILKYSRNFGGLSRDVFLQGEAFFNISHDSERPFKVKTEDALITVLGTSFNVRVDEEMRSTSVDVKMGRVEVESLKSGKNVIVKAGESAIFNVLDDSFDHHVSLTTNADSWLDNTFSFNATPLKLVFSDLSRHFGINFNIVNKEVEECLFTSGEFQNENLSEIIEVLEGAFPLKIFKEKENHYKVQGSTCK